MASEKSNGEKLTMPTRASPRRNIERGIYPNKEVVDLTDSNDGSYDNTSPTYPCSHVGNIHGMPQYHHPEISPPPPASNVMDGVSQHSSFLSHEIQPDHSEIFDRSSLRSGAKADIEITTKNNSSSRDGASKTMGSDSPLFNTSHGLNADRSSLRPGFNMAGGFSGFQRHVDGFTRVARQGELPSIGSVGGVFPQLSEFYGMRPNMVGVFAPAQNVDGFSSVMQNVDGISGVLQHEGGRTFSPSEMQHYSLMPSNWNSGLGQNMNPRFAAAYPTTGFLGFPTESTISNNNNLVRAPGYVQYRASAFPLLSSSIGMHGPQPSFSQIQGNYPRIVGNLPFGQVQSPPRIAGNLSFGQIQSSSPSIVGNLSTVPSPVFPLVGITRSLAPLAQSNNLGQSPASMLIHPQILHQAPYTSGQQITAANVPAHISHLPHESSRKRGTSQWTQAASQAQRLRIKPYSRPSPNEVNKATPAHASLGRTAPSSPSSAQPPPQVNATPQHQPFLPNISAPHYIKRQGITPPPSGIQCRLCKRDLSYTPEGPVYQPRDPPPVSVLPCKHIFHDQCLQLITPEGEAHNPPCIPCAMGEKN